MNIIINKNINIGEPEIIINCMEINEDILRIMAHIETFDKRIIGVIDEKTFVLDLKNILYFESVDKRTFAYTSEEIYEIHLRLYELEENLKDTSFFRGTKATIVNLDMIKVITPTFGGKLEVELKNEERLIISRKYVSVLKEKLGINRY